MKNKKLALIWMYGKIILGSASFAAGFQFFLYPNDIVPGGITGVSMIINQLTGFPVGVLTIILNIPIFILAWRVLGRSFVVGSLAGMGLSSVLVDVFGLLPQIFTGEPLLGTIFGGALSGLGLGLVFSAGASTGGSDVIAKLLRRKLTHLNMGQLVLMVDFVVITAAAIVFRSLEPAMYAIISLFISSKMIDFVLYGFDYAKVAYIISDRHETLCDEISARLDRGVTLLYGKGAYTGTDKMVLMCAIKRNQIVELKKAVMKVDENAFIIITDSREVFGSGFSDIDD